MSSSPCHGALNLPTPGQQSVGGLLESARDQLDGAPFEIARREAGLLLSRVLDTSEATVLAYPERRVSPPDERAFDDLIRRRLAGEPVAYLFEEREFWGLDFYVDDRVLVPRPETEHLVETALALDIPPDGRVLDLCTGSGCVAIALASERPGWTVYASDISPAALAVARQNIQRHRLQNVHVLASDLMQAIDGDFDLVTANPPYLDHEDKTVMSIEVTEWEPALALFPRDGRALSVYRRLLNGQGALRGQRRGTPVLFEIDSRRAQLVTDLARDAGARVQAVIADLASRPRVVHLETPG